ncbi:MAG: Planctomycete cytochrome, partial [Verrucomicrobiaceae bacterium]|nr:Planctomycete cytochrome [Verrucomicrobiaceae bacterium]
MAAPAPDGEVLFATKILPLFNEKCLACHGKEPLKLKGGYDMRTRDALFKGGDSGTLALITGNADASPLYLAVTRAHEDDWKPMPPKLNDKLSTEQTDEIKAWINAGAPWPDEAKTKALADKWSAPDGVTVKTSGGLGDDWTNRRYKPENLWAYQPVKPLRTPEGQNPVDALIALHLPAGVTPAPRAEARTLIRRITYDLTGLPPTPEEITAFEGDTLRNPQSAIPDLIDRLLASPHYGEHWGRHWLDVVRYADTSGFANDYERGNAWRYRDYVIRSFNNDKPYNEFITEQIAGDELDEHRPENLVACGFLRMGPWELTSMEVPKIARQRFLDDVTNSVGEVFLAHSL